MRFKITWLVGTDDMKADTVEASDLLQAVNTLCKLRDVEPSEVVAAVHAPGSTTNA